MKKRAVLCAMAILSILALLLCWPAKNWSADDLDPRLRVLKGPYQSVLVSFYLDGGSLGIKIIDSKNRKVELALPISEKGERYPRLFVGGLHVNKGASEEIPFDPNTRNWLMATLENHRGENEGYAYLALVGLRGWPKDYVQFWFDAVCRRMAGK